MAIILIISLSFLLFERTSPDPTSFSSSNPVVLVKVYKTDHRLELWTENQALAQFHIALGSNTIGHKQQEGDGKTPEGRYMLDYKNANSAYFRSIHISYPNTHDIENAKQKGVSAGSQIMIHGQRNGTGWLGWFTQHFDWTQGCIALTNDDMALIWKLIQTPTPIEIYP